MKEIILTKGQRALVDDADFSYLNQFSWYAVRPRKASYSHSWYAARWTPAKQVSMHHFLMAPQAGLCVDHVDGNGLNNQRANLRICSPTENAWNSRKYANATSRHKGVSWNSEKQKWQARICIFSKEKHLGWFSEEIQAAQVYDFVARQAFGPFARLNFPEASR